MILGFECLWNEAELRLVAARRRTVLAVMAQLLRLPLRAARSTARTLAAC
jgi:hypothetical protein